MRRAIEIKMIDGTSVTLELSKATSIREDIGMLHIDKLDSGTWRLLFSKDIAEDFKKIESFNMISED